MSLNCEKDVSVQSIIKSARMGELILNNDNNASNTLSISHDTQQTMNGKLHISQMQDKAILS